MRKRAMKVRRGAEHLNVIASRVLGGMAYQSAIYRYKAAANYHYLWNTFDAVFPDRSFLTGYHGRAFPDEWQQVLESLPVIAARGGRDGANMGDKKLQVGRCTPQKLRRDTRSLRRLLANQ